MITILIHYTTKITQPLINKSISVTYETSEPVLRRRPIFFVFFAAPDLRIIKTMVHILDGNS